MEFIGVGRQIKVLLPSAFVVPNVFIVAAYQEVIAQRAAAVFAVDQLMGSLFFAPDDGQQRNAVQSLRDLTTGEIDERRHDILQTGGGRVAHTALFPGDPEEQGHMDTALVRPGLAVSMMIAQQFTMVRTEQNNGIV